MSFLTLRAYLELVHFDLYLARGDFLSLYEKVRRCRVVRAEQSQAVIDRVCTAVDVASIWYWKQVRCLQRSAVTACLLKRYGVRSQMVIGAQPQFPFRVHAWVEVGGSVVNDKPYMRQIYAVIDRC
jgi:hypothetical protein